MLTEIKLQFTLKSAFLHIISPTGYPNCLSLAIVATIKDNSRYSIVFFEYCSKLKG